MLRSATDADRDAILALGVAEEEAWFGAPDVTLGEVGEWVDDEGGVSRGVVAVDEAGQISGFVSPGRRRSVFLADPARADALVDELLPWLSRQGDVVELQTFAGDSPRIRAFERHGLRHRRSSFSLARPESAGPVPPAVFPDGVEVAPYEWGQADEAIHRLIYLDAEWAAIPGHRERDLTSWLTSERSCNVIFLASREQQPIGWIDGRVLASGRGYVSTLAVATSERGRGVGRALLLEAFAKLQAAGARGLALDVEAADQAALGLYRSVGLAIEREWRVYATSECVD